MDVRIAERLTALFARKTGNEAVAEKIVASLMERLSSSRSESSCELHAPSNHGPLGCPSPSMREGSPLGSSNPLLNGMKSGGKDSRELDFEKFISSVAAPTVAQAPSAPGPANRAILDVSEAFSALPQEIRSQLYDPNYLGEYLRSLFGEGSKIISIREERGELSQTHSDALIEICEELTGLAQDVARLAAAAGESKPKLESQSARLAELLENLETLLKEISGREHLFA